MTDSFKEQYLHPNWQKRRLERLEAAGWGCEQCDATETTLHVHHKKYVRGRKVWEYEDDELQVLCEPCHSRHHDDDRLLKEVLAEGYYTGYAGTKTVAGQAAAIMAGYISADIGGWLPQKTVDACKTLNGFGFYRGVVAHALGLICAKHGAIVADLLEQIYRDSGWPLEPEVERAVSLFRAFSEKAEPSA